MQAAVNLKLLDLARASYVLYGSKHIYIYEPSFHGEAVCKCLLAR